MWEYAKETDAYNAETEKILCWMIENENLVSVQEIENYFEDEKIEVCLERLQHAALSNDGPHDLRNGYFVSDNEYIQYLEWKEKAEWFDGKWQIKKLSHLVRLIEKAK